MVSAASMLMDWGWIDKLNGTYSNNNNPYEKEFSVVLNNESDNLFDVSSIKYVIIPLEDKNLSETYYNYFKDHFGSREFFIRAVDDLKFLNRTTYNNSEL